MKLKANFHLHSKEDDFDVLSYTIYEAIDRAFDLGYRVLAWTPHRQVLGRQEHVDYAKAKGMVLFIGIEAKIEGREVLLINCSVEAEKIKTFEQLREYKKNNKNLLIIAPHPFFPARTTLREKLEENIDLFDAIELSWFHTAKTDFNVKGKEVASKYGKPFIATSDTHYLPCLEKSYAVLDCELDEQGVLEAVRSSKFENYSQAISFLYAVFFILWLDYRPIVLLFKLKKKIRRFFRKHFKRG
jgi:predicted metal-dependent phosphoesterase TrpH